MSTRMIDEMVNRFLGWKLPRDFCPDAGISFKPTRPYEGDEFGNPWWPVGTNLLTADQAREMFKACVPPEFGSELERLGDIMQKQGELILMQEQELLALRGPLAPVPDNSNSTVIEPV